MFKIKYLYLCECSVLIIMFNVLNSKFVVVAGKIDAPPPSTNSTVIGYFAALTFEASPCTVILNVFLSNTL